MSIGRNITILMYDKDIKSRDLAKKIGVSESTISKIRNNERLPSLRLTQKMADALDCTVDELLREA